MRHSIVSIQGSEIVGWRVIDESAVFGSDKETVSEIEVSACAVHEGGAGLCADFGEVLRIEN